MRIKNWGIFSVLVLVTSLISGCSPGPKFSEAELQNFAKAVETALTEDTAKVVAGGALTGKEYLESSAMKWGTPGWFPRSNLQGTTCEIGEDRVTVICLGSFEGSNQACEFHWPSAFSEVPVDTSILPQTASEVLANPSAIINCAFESGLTTLDEDSLSNLDFSKIPCSAELVLINDPFEELSCSNHVKKQSERWENRSTNKDYWSVNVWLVGSLHEEYCESEAREFPGHDRAEDVTLVGENWWTSFRAGDGNEKAMLEVQRQLGGSIVPIYDFCSIPTYGVWP